MAALVRDDMIPAYFRRTDEVFEPLDLSRSEWNVDHLHGVAVSGLLACGAEEAIGRLGRAEFVPSRFHVDLFRPSRMSPTRLRTEVVRSSTRLTLIDVSLIQGQQQTARASCLFLRPSQSPPGAIWGPEDRPVPPSRDLANELMGGPPCMASSEPWSNRFEDHQNEGRHQMWHQLVPIVLDEPGTTFQATAGIADTANMVCNWGSGGVPYINSDLSLMLARRPGSMEVGLRALDHVQRDGVSVATAEVFDREGPLGTVSVTAVASPMDTLDFGGKAKGN